MQRTWGNCSAEDACTSCTASGSPEIIPNLPNTSFDQGGLRCSGESACTNIPGTWKFQDSSNFLSCTGSGSCRSFFVENVGAVCCDSYFVPCEAGTYTLTTDPASTCTQDVCSRGELAFNANPRLKNVNSLYCSGRLACSALKAELSGDVFCDGDSFGTCSSSLGSTSFTFEANDDHQHCIQCISNGNAATCRSVLFDFTAIPAAPNTTVRMKCEGSNACGEASRIALTAGVTLYIHCDGGSTCQALNVDTGALGISGFGSCCVPLNMRSS